MPTKKNSELRHVLPQLTNHKIRNLLNEKEDNIALYSYCCLPEMPKGWNVDKYNGFTLDVDTFNQEYARRLRYEIEHWDCFRPRRLIAYALKTIATAPGRGAGTFVGNPMYSRTGNVAANFVFWNPTSKLFESLPHGWFLVERFDTPATAAKCMTAWLPYQLAKPNLELVTKLDYSFPQKLR